MTSDVKYFLIFLCLFGSTAASAQEEVLFRGAGDAFFYIDVYGEFSAQSRWDINLINAPLGSFTKKPPDMNVSKETLKFLNGKYAAVFQKIFKHYHMNVSWKESDYKKLKKKARPILDENGDQYFYMQVFIGGDNHTGGQYGGLDLRIKLMSFHRRGDLIYGYAMKPVSPASSPDSALANVQQTFTELLKEASGDWVRVLENEKNKPRRSFRLAVNFDRVNKDQKKYVKGILMPCLFDQGSSLQYFSDSDEDNTYVVTYRLKRYDEKETEEDYIKRYADQLLYSIGSYGKYPCSLWKSPLEGYKAKIQTDVEKKLITISWYKP